MYLSLEGVLTESYEASLHTGLELQIEIVLLLLLLAWVTSSGLPATACCMQVRILLSSIFQTLGCISTIERPTNAILAMIRSQT